MHSIYIGRSYQMESLHYLLMKTHTMLNRHILSEAMALGYSAGQPKVLEYLSKNEGSDQKTIAAYCEIEQATVGSILLRMESAGLIERRQKDGNRRSLYVYLTEKGKKGALELSDVFSRADDLAEAALTSEEIYEVKRLLEKIYCSLDSRKGE